MSRVLVVSPHPDDEAIGCGGTLRKHVVDGDQVRAVFLTSGEKGGHGRSPGETGPLREREAEQAAAILGLDGVEFFREPDGGLRATDAVVERLAERLGSFSPDLVYVPNRAEMHDDHRAGFEVASLAVARAGLGDGRPQMLAFEVWTPLQQVDHIVDISPFIDVKRAAIRAHASQCAVMRFDEAMVGLNRYRGELYSWPGGDYAEVFVRVTP